MENEVKEPPVKEKIVSSASIAKRNINKILAVVTTMAVGIIAELPSKVNSIMDKLDKIEKLEEYEDRISKLERYSYTETTNMGDMILKAMQNISGEIKSIKDSNTREDNMLETLDNMHGTNNFSPPPRISQTINQSDEVMLTPPPAGSVDWSPQSTVSPTKENHLVNIKENIKRIRKGYSPEAKGSK